MPRLPRWTNTRATVKITDVAALAGVAPMTVSRVMNTPDRVAEGTARRVRAAIEQLGYVPNLIAGTLSSRRSKMIAALVPTIASPMFSSSIQALTDRLDEAGYHLMLGLSGYDTDTEDAVVHAILGRRPDGMMLTGTQHSAATNERLRAAGMPIVEIWDSAEQPTDMIVGFDHAEVGADVARFFLERGHQHFAFLGADDDRAAKRRAGFVRQVARSGGTLVADSVTRAPSDSMDGRNALRAIAPHLGRRTAMFCSSDLVAFGAIVEAMEIGIAVPERLAICGFGDFDIGRAMKPGITTVAANGADIGRLAAECLINRLTGGAPAARTLVPVRISPRGST